MAANGNVNLVNDNGDGNGENDPSLTELLASIPSSPTATLLCFDVPLKGSTHSILFDVSMIYDMRTMHVTDPPAVLVSNDCDNDEMIRFQHQFPLINPSSFRYPSSTDCWERSLFPGRESDRVKETYGNKGKGKHIHSFVH
jgi:hypothetical protein